MTPIHSKTVFLLEYKKRFGSLPPRVNVLPGRMEDIQKSKRDLAATIDDMMGIEVSDDYMKYIGNEIRVLDLACQQDLAKNGVYHYDWVDHFDGH